MMPTVPLCIHFVFVAWRFILLICLQNHPEEDAIYQRDTAGDGCFCRASVDWAGPGEQSPQQQRDCSHTSNQLLGCETLLGILRHSAYLKEIFKIYNECVWVRGKILSQADDGKFNCTEQKTARFVVLPLNTKTDFSLEGWSGHSSKRLHQFSWISVRTSQKVKQQIQLPLSWHFKQSFVYESYPRSHISYPQIRSVPYWMEKKGFLKKY